MTSKLELPDKRVFYVVKQFGKFTMDPASINASAQGATNVTIAGLKTTDFVIVQCQDAGMENLTFISAYVSAQNVLTIRLFNGTGAAINGAARTWAYIAYGY